MFCTDGIFEAMNDAGVEFGARRLCEVVQRQPHAHRRATIVDAIFDAVTAFRGSAPQNDDMTAVAVKITR